MPAICSLPIFRYSHSTRNIPSRYDGPAFVFDIDGVIIRDKVLPPAQTALQTLYDNHRQQWIAPIVFLTNGGGITEAQRAEKLTSLLKLPIDATMIVLSHTPLQQYVPQYNAPDTAVLTIGGAQCAHIARTYGFTNALDTTHLAAINPTAAPFARTQETIVSDAERHAAQLRIGAMFVMTDSRDWGRDAQLMLDIMRQHRNENDHPPDLFFSNADLIFPTAHPRPRLAAGAFRLAFNAVYRSVVDDAPPPATLLGKPYAPNYEAAERAICTQLQRLNYDDGSNLPNIYAIGDNPSSDVRGANNRGAPWRSVLVRTGNFPANADVQSLPPADTPNIVVDDVDAAVRHALEESSGTLNVRRHE